MAEKGTASRRGTNFSTEDKLDMSLDDVVVLNKGGQDKDRERDRTRDRMDFERGGGERERRGRSRSRTRSRSRSKSPNRAPLPNAGCRIFVGNVHFSVAWQDLKDVMKKAGPVKQVEMLTYPDGRSKGCALVEFETEEGAKRAMEQLTNVELAGRKIFIREDREAEKGNIFPSRQGPLRRRSPPPYSGGYGSRDIGARDVGRMSLLPRGSDVDPLCQVYVGNLNFSVSWQDLKDFFRQAGFDVVRTEILAGPDGMSRGAGTVLFKTAREAAAAISRMHGVMFRNRPVDVHLDKFAGQPSLPPASLRSDRDRDRYSSIGGSLYDRDYLPRFGADRDRGVLRDDRGRAGDRYLPASTYSRGGDLGGYGGRDIWGIRDFRDIRDRYGLADRDRLMEREREYDRVERLRLGASRDRLDRYDRY
eukprot:comp23419_c0_seq1/m.38933 comp23419_c0_seq1/g.38933  ORF comp23419_c0_seq1/g.38933 comp23419_c0_seq1/m.38933 type:complete len:419 (-) comp23419_c0_seq1:450-1706(-)